MIDPPSLVDEIVHLISMFDVIMAYNPSAATQKTEELLEQPKHKAAEKYENQRKNQHSPKICIKKCDVIMKGPYRWVQYHQHRTHICPTCAKHRETRYNHEEPHNTLVTKGKSRY